MTDAAKAIWTAIGMLSIYMTLGALYAGLNWKDVGHPDTRKDAMAKCAIDFGGKIVIVCIIGIVIVIQLKAEVLFGPSH